MKKVFSIVETYKSFLFIILLIVFYFILDYQTILFLRPQGIHFIRQTDSLSFVANYYKNGLDFFHPQIFNLSSFNGQAASEFPIIYYLTAVLYSIFNEHEFFLRLITIVIASTGFLFLFKLLYALLKDLIYAIAFSFIFISSTVLLYYTNNFLPDASALGITLIAWYHYFAFANDRNRKRSLWLSFSFFLLASLIKVTYFINPLAAIISLVLYDISKRAGIINAIKSNIKPLIIFACTLILVLGWNIYVLNYNTIHQNQTFLMQALPIWTMSQTEISIVWDHMNNYWHSNYYYQSTFHFFYALLIIGLIFINKSNRLVFLTSIILLIGTLCYFFLFFSQFKFHDYYAIALLPALILCITSAFIAIRNKFPKWINHGITKAIVVTLCILSLNYADKKLSQRYNNKFDQYANIGNLLISTRQYLDSIGISEYAKFIIISDLTPNGGLYFINRPGWSLKDSSEENIVLVKKYIREGAEYIIYTDEKYIDNTINGIKIGEDNGISIYKTASPI